MDIFSIIRLFGGLARSCGGKLFRGLMLALCLLGMGVLCLLGASEFFPWEWACGLRRPFSTLFKQIQYPWRLVGVAAPMLSVAAVWGLMRGGENRRGALALIAALSLVFGGYIMQVFVQDAPLITQDSYCDTRIGQYEYTYEGTEKSALVPGEIVAGKAASFTVREYEKQGTNLSFILDAPDGCAYVEVPLLYYPGYHAEVNGMPARAERGSNNVLRIYGVPEHMDYHVRVWYREPLAWTVSAVGSLAGAALLVFFCARCGKKARRRIG